VVGVMHHLSVDRIWNAVALVSDKNSVWKFLSFIV
jgi:hypothetical protein